MSALEPEDSIESESSDSETSDAGLLESQFTHSPLWGNQRILDVMNIAFQSALTNTAPRITQPSSIPVPLRPHQLALVHAMRQKEQECMAGIPFSNTRTYANYGILGDDVGTGKSLVVLSFLASLKESPTPALKRNALYSYSSKNLFTVETNEIVQTTPRYANLLVVPHTIFKQWHTYCKEQTKLNVFAVKLQREIQMAFSPKKEEVDALRQKLVGADLVLISNTLYGTMQLVAERLKVRWLRMFFDEADSIHITSTTVKPNAIFTWFITATWPNLILDGSTVRPATLATLQESPPNKYNPLLEQWLQNELGLKVGTHSYGRYVAYGLRSKAFFRDYQSSHILRGQLVLSTHPDFLKESEQMPPIRHTTLLCEQSRSSRAVRGLVNSAVQTMLDAGNIEGALEQLGVSVQSAGGLVEAVTKERRMELARLQKTYEFKSEMEYASPTQKEQALANLQQKMKSVQEQLATLEGRLGELNTTEECPICYDNAKENNCTLTPCCHRMFCGACLLQSLTRQPTCPLCRSAVVPAQLIHVKPTNDLVKAQKEEKTLLSKPKQLLEFLKKNPKARVLIFSRYENPFTSLGLTFAQEGISHHILRGNKDVVANIVKSFEAGEKRVLFLQTESAGAGINLVSATHVVLLHAMTPDEEKQVIGRAYRLGRKDPLEVVHLLHEGETPT